MAHGLSLLRLTFLGTAAAQPTKERNVSGIAVKADSDLLLFDCGEGSQRQMIRFGTGFSLTAAFFTHFHADHYLGIIGFLRTLGMQGRQEPVVLYGPAGARDLLGQAIHLGVDSLTFPVDLQELAPGDEVPRSGYRVRAVAADHRVNALGYVLDEETRPGRFDVAAAQALGIAPGPSYTRLQQGEPITLADGRIVHPDQVLGPARPGRRLALSGDTRPTAGLAAAAQNADVLVHEATFSDDEQERALLTKHATAREAGRIAREARARRLVLTHLSSRHDSAPERLRAEAQQEFSGSVEIAYDGLTIVVDPTDESNP